MSITLSIEGADELAAEMKRMSEQYPDQCNAAMKRIAKEFRDDVNVQFPGSYASGKRPFAKSWKTTYETSSLGLITETEIANRAPHWHLVENGHHIVPQGGSVEAKNYAKRVEDDYESRYPQIMEAAVTLALGKAGLL